MNRLILPAACVLLLSACGRADGELEPGNWKSTMGMEKFEIPGAPAEIQRQATAMMAQTQSMEACMTAAQAKLGVRDFSRSMQQGDCQMNDFTSGGGKMSGTMDCKSGSMGATSMKMEGTYTEQKVEMRLAGAVLQPSLPGGKANIAMKISSERTGDCKS